MQVSGKRLVQRIILFVNRNAPLNDLKTKGVWIIGPVDAYVGREF